MSAVKLTRAMGIVYVFRLRPVPVAPPTASVRTDISQFACVIFSIYTLWFICVFFCAAASVSVTRSRSLFTRNKAFVLFDRLALRVLLLLYSRWHVCRIYMRVIRLSKITLTITYQRTESQRNYCLHNELRPFYHLLPRTKSIFSSIIDRFLEFLLTFTYPQSIITSKSDHILWVSVLRWNLPM